MRMLTLVATLGVTALLTSSILAQGGRGRGRAEEIQTRVGAYFTDTNGPTSDGDKAGDLAATDLVRAAAGVGQLTVLYLVDSSDDQDVRDQFERMLFAGDELGIQLRCFHCGRIDLKKEASLKAKWGKQAPLFLVFDKDGKAGEVVSMVGYKVAANALEKQLEKAAQGVVKPSLATFAKDYASLVRDLEQALNKKKLAQGRQAKAGADKAKRAEAEKDVKAIEGEEQKLLDREKDMLAKMQLPERPTGARRLGGRGEGGGPGGQGGQGGRPGG